MADHTLPPTRPLYGDWLAELTINSWNLARNLRRVFAAGAAPLGLDDDQFLVLACLAAQDGQLSQVAIAESLGISPAQISGLVERMREQGWLQASRDPRDRRRQLWGLTPAGRTQYETTCRSFKSATEHLVGHLLPVSRDLLLHLLQDLARSSAKLEAKLAAEKDHPATIPFPTPADPAASSGQRRAA